MIWKTSLVCLLLVIYMGLFYFSNKHLPLRSTRIFRYYYVSAVILNLFDFITVYTVNHMELVTSGLNLLLHVIYLLSINITLLLYFLYIRSLLERKRKISGVVQYLHAVPFAVTSILILFLPLTYVEGEHTNYSFGPKVYALYASVLFYNLLILYHCVRDWKLFNKEKRMAILASVPVFLCVSIINIVFPEVLVTIVYVVLTTAGLMLSSENCEKYIDKQTGMFNRYALGIVVDDYMATGKNVFVVVVTLAEGNNMQDVIEWQQYIAAMEELQSFCKKELKHRTYRVTDNGFVLLTGSAQTALQKAAAIRQHVERHWKNEMSASHKAFALNTYTSSEKLLSEIVEICTGAINRMAIFDLLTGVRNRNSFEKELVKLREEGVDAFCFLVDINNLKTTNDAMGHSAGDELLKVMAKLLKDTTGKEGLVFRYGGDEFVVLWRGTDTATFLEKLEKNSRQVNEPRIIPVSFAIGYGRILDSDGLKKADKMMYENKIRIKKGE